jgi:large subunit ribosomal protein L35
MRKYRYAKNETHKGAAALQGHGHRKGPSLQAFKSHILTKKTSKRKRRLRQAGIVATTGDTKRVKRLIQA